MYKTYFTYLFILLLLTLNSCKDEPISYERTLELRITSPSNNDIFEEETLITIKMDTNLDTLLNKIEIFYRYAADSPEFNKVEEDLRVPPFEKKIFVQQGCFETDTLVIYAKATYNSTFEIVSDTVKVLVTKNIPPEDSISIYDYNAYDLNSNLVATGQFSMHLYNDFHIYGRKNITAINPELAYEKGVGLIKGGMASQGSTAGDFNLNLNYCERGDRYTSIGGKKSGEIYTFSGVRYRLDSSPVGERIGTFTAVKRTH